MAFSMSSLPSSHDMSMSDPGTPIQCEVSLLSRPCCQHGRVRPHLKAVAVEQAARDIFAAAPFSPVPASTTSHANISSRPSATHQKQSKPTTCTDRIVASPTARHVRLNPSIAKVQHKGSHRSKEPANIKEWAALTTWLRMNLHQV